MRVSDTVPLDDEIDTDGDGCIEAENDIVAGATEADRERAMVRVGEDVIVNTSDPEPERDAKGIDSVADREGRLKVVESVREPGSNRQAQPSQSPPPSCTSFHPPDANTERWSSTSHELSGCPDAQLLYIPFADEPPVLKTLVTQNAVPDPPFALPRGPSTHRYVLELPLVAPITSWENEVFEMVS